jgi:asparagine synthase (glutamine-hydrolysing)
VIEDRGGRDGLRWWCALPDLDAAASVADLLAAEADTVVAHDSGRPWLVGHGTGSELRTVVVGPTQVAVIGTCLGERRGAADARRARGPTRRLRLADRVARRLSPRGEDPGRDGGIR